MKRDEARSEDRDQGATAAKRRAAVFPDLWSWPLALPYADIYPPPLTCISWPVMKLPSWLARNT